MTDLTEHDTDGAAHSVFAGMTPNAFARHTAAARRSADRSRLNRGMLATGSVLLVGSMAAMTLNLTGPIEPLNAKQPPKPRGAAFDQGKTVREAIAASTVAAAAATIAGSTTIADAAPTSYVVAAGDSISSIAERYGLSTASLLALNGLGWSSLIFPGQELKLGGITPIAQVEAEPVAVSGSYTIVAGDTIGGIADRFGISTLSLLTANSLGWSSIIYPGQTLVIPGLGDGEALTPVVSIEPSIEPVVESPAESAPATGPAGSYTIEAGDTVGSIAEAHGISTEALLDANAIDESTVIFSGDSLTIPYASGAVSAPVPAPAPAPASTGGTIAYLNDDMRANASVIVQVGRELGVSDYGIVIALATAMQESTMRNINWGDLDSVGLFQQRPSAGWGSVENLTTPSYAARLFYGGESNPNRGKTSGLLDVAGWESMSLTDAAQRVQISAYPDAYAKWEASAWSWLAELG